MNKLFNFKNLIVSFIYCINFLLCLLVYAYFSIDIDFLKQGSMPNQQFFYLSLDKIYLGVILICAYYTYSTIYLFNSPFYQKISPNLRLSGWIFDSILAFIFFAYCLIINYIGYYQQTVWKPKLIFKSFISYNPMFYISLIIYLLINYGIYTYFKKRT